MNYSSDWKNLTSAFGYGFVDDIEQYKHIVKVWAYTDMQPRTIHGLKDFRDDPINRKKLEVLFDYLARELYDFITDKNDMTEPEFDEWHKKLCEYFVKEFNSITKGKGVDSIKFGKAQKIVNVSFKYIYCLKGASAYTKKFSHCHMVLDRYTYNEGFYKVEIYPFVCGIKPVNLTPWSNLNFNEYKDIQQNIRGFFNKTTEYVDASGVPLTPFQAEFYIFNKYTS